MGAISEAVPADLPSTPSRHFTNVHFVSADHAALAGLFSAPRGAGVQILARGATIWFLAHLGAREAEHDFVERAACRVHIPINEMGSFDSWAWQFLWILGCMGLGRAGGNRIYQWKKWARRVVVPAAIVFAILLPLRYAVGRWVELGAFEPLFDKWHFGVVRLINFAAVAALLIRFQRILKPLAVRPLVQLGQASLQVFCVHLLFTFAGLTLLGNAAMLSPWKQVALLAATFGAMLLTARIFSKSEAKTERKDNGAARESRSSPWQQPFRGYWTSRPAVLRVWSAIPLATRNSRDSGN